MRYLRFYFFLFLLFFCVFFVVTKSRNDYKKQTVVSVCKNEALNVKKFHGMVKPQFSSNLSFQSDGRIVYFPFSNGDFVKKGQVIARLDGVLYNIKKDEESARLNEALIQYNKTQNYYKRMDILHKVGAISDNDWEEAYYQLKTDSEQIKIQKEKINYLNTQIAYNALIAPYDGYVFQKFAQIGETVKTGQHVLVFMGSNDTRIEITIDEKDVNLLSLGLGVDIVKNKKTYKGKISHISKNSTNSGGYLVKIDINSLIPELKDGMDVEVEIPFLNRSVSYLPIEAVFENNGKKFVYKIVNIKDLSGEIFEKEVVVGEVLNNKIEILSGLNDGDVVVCSARASVKQKDRVKIEYEI